MATYNLETSIQNAQSIVSYQHSIVMLGADLRFICVDSFNNHLQMAGAYK
jgi:hypothetical protein